MYELVFSCLYFLSIAGSFIIASISLRTIASITLQNSRTYSQNRFDTTFAELCVLWYFGTTQLETGYRIYRDIEYSWFDAVSKSISKLRRFFESNLPDYVTPIDSSIATPFQRQKCVDRRRYPVSYWESQTCFFF